MEQRWPARTVGRCHPSGRCFLRWFLARAHNVELFEGLSPLLAEIGNKRIFKPCALGRGVLSYLVNRRVTITEPRQF